jgi:hypothetical protein
MTTGRINQVTIVRRGWPPAHVSAPERCYKLLDGARGVSHERAVPRWPSARRLRPPGAAICFPPLRSPGHPSARHLARREGGWCGLGAPGGGPVAQFLPFGVHCTGAVSRCSGGRTCQRPVTHRAHPSAKGGFYASRRLEASPVRRAGTEGRRLRGGRVNPVNSSGPRLLCPGATGLKVAPRRGPRNVPAR